MFELNIIKSLLNRDNYLKYRNYLKEESLTKELRPLLTTLDRVYEKTNTSVSLDDFYNHFFSDVYHNTDYYKQVFDTLSKKPELDSTEELLESFHRQSLLEEISVTAFEVKEGKASPEKLASLYEKLSKPKATFNLPILDITPENLLEGGSSIPGLRWRLKSLNRMLGSLRKGDFGFFFARPETGKTAMLASEISYMLPQLKPEDGPIIWFNNEEGGKKVVRRVVQAYHGIDGKQLDKDIGRYTESFLKSHNNRFIFVDNAVLDKWEVEKYLAYYKPSLILFDQLDKVYGFKADREDLRMGAIYQWARELAKSYCPTLGVCQADGTAQDTEYLSMAQVSNSKTSKSAEADFIVGIGYKDLPGYEQIRYLSVCKNKLVGDEDTEPALRHGKLPVLIKPEIMRYEDIE